MTDTVTADQEADVYEKALSRSEDRCLRLLRALTTISEMPTPAQDNMISANMRKIATESLTL